MFRRMVFNVLTGNKDDHAKNFSFICREGVWSLAPAYDLTRCSEGYNGEHATSVNNNGKPAVEDLIAVGESIRIPRKLILPTLGDCSKFSAPVILPKIIKRNENVNEFIGDWITFLYCSTCSREYYELYRKGIGDVCRRFF